MNRNVSASSDEVKERLKVTLNIKTDRELAEVLGIAPPSVSNWKKRNTIPYDICVQVATEHQISLDWLILGLGPSGNETIDARFVSTPKPSSERAYVSVPVYDMMAKAKPNQVWNGAGVVTELKFARDWLEDEGLDAGALMAMRVMDDCMVPTLKPGDMVVINRQKTAGDGVFLVRVGSELKVKRLQWLMDGRLKVASDNPCYEEEVVVVGDMLPGQFEVVGGCCSRLGRV